MARKKLFYHSDFSLIKTGFGKTARLILSYLYNTGKYDITHFCCGIHNNHHEFDRVPWKCIGALPINNDELQRDPKLAQMASYGAITIDEVMKEEQPDVYIGVQDIWGCDFAIDKDWFTPSNMSIWTTLDSLPILPTAVKAASKMDEFWCWSGFATKSLHELGHKHVRTVRGPLETKDFFKLDDQINARNRNLFGIGQDDFVVGFVFRNQLRKSVPNLLEGYKLFLDNNPDVKRRGTKLLLHTSFTEGWGIHKLADELGVDKDHILTTYSCQNCHSFGVHNYKGEQLTCPYCKSEKTYMTTGIQSGVTEEQLNQVYNLMDVYCHPFTSGGQEIPIQEAKLTELITLVTNYSCGEDNCVEEARSLPLDWSEYREHNTEFIKASTSPVSIAEQLEKVYNMPKEEREREGKKAREWVVENFAVEVIGRQIEEFIDSAPEMDKKKTYEIRNRKNPHADVDSALGKKEWIQALYRNILGIKVDESDAGYKYWSDELTKGKITRPDVEAFFRKTAVKEKALASDRLSAFGVLKEDRDKKRLLFMIPESIGDVYMCTSLLRSIRETYPDYLIYVATKPEYFGVLDGNDYVDRIISYDPQMENLHGMQGYSNRALGDPNNEGVYEIVLIPHISAQRIPTYTHHGLDEIKFDLMYKEGHNKV